MPTRILVLVAAVVSLVAGAVTPSAQAPPTPQVAAAPAGTEPFIFIQLSDPQFGFFNNDIDFPQETANFEFAVATVNRLKPSFVVITGDLVNKPGDTVQIAEYDRIKALLDPSIPIYDMAGNHDIENAPTPATVAAYRARYGPDFYSFRFGSLYGIVLDSTVIHTPDGVPDVLAEQDAWLRTELDRATASDARHVVIFQHHPWFLETADEDDQYFNIPRVRRDPMLALFRAHGVRTLVSGHLHRNAVANDAGFDSIVTGPVGRPLGTDGSGLRVFRVTDDGIAHRYYHFGELPTSINPAVEIGGRGRGGRGAAPRGGGAPGEGSGRTGRGGP